jgi:hypothetical protein
MVAECSAPRGNVDNGAPDIAPGRANCQHLNPSLSTECEFGHVSEQAKYGGFGWQPGVKERESKTRICPNVRTSGLKQAGLASLVQSLFCRFARSIGGLNYPKFTMATRHLQILLPPKVLFSGISVLPNTNANNTVRYTTMRASQLSASTLLFSTSFQIDMPQQTNLESFCLQFMMRPSRYCPVDSYSKMYIELPTSLSVVDFRLINTSHDSNRNNNLPSNIPSHLRSLLLLPDYVLSTVLKLLQLLGLSGSTCLP